MSITLHKSDPSKFSLISPYVGGADVLYVDNSERYISYKLFRGVELVRSRHRLIWICTVRTLLYYMKYTQLFNILIRPTIILIIYSYDLFHNKLLKKPIAVYFFSDSISNSIIDQYESQPSYTLFIFLYASYVRCYRARSSLFRTL